MRTHPTIVLVIVLVLASVCTLPVQMPHWAPSKTGGAATPGEPHDSTRVAEALAGLEGYFLENDGQVANPDVRYYAMGDPLSVGFTKSGIVFMAAQPGFGSPFGPRSGSQPPAGYSSFMLSFAGGRQVEPSARSPLVHPTNFVLGNDPSRWVAGAMSYSEVWYWGVFDCVDIRFYFLDDALKYDLVLGAGSDPETVVLAYEGVQALSVDATTGDLLVETPALTFRDTRPVVTSIASGPCAPIRIDYMLLEGGRFRYDIPQDVMRLAPIVIDPGLRYSTLLGSSKANDHIYSIELDKAGNVIVAGMTYSSDFPTTPGAYNRTWAASKGFVAKLDPTLSNLLFLTFYGGDHQTIAYATSDYYIGVLPDGDILLVGYTASDNFPTTANALERNYRGKGDLYIMVLGGDGGGLVYSSYFGGGDSDGYPYATVDDDGALYLMGQTQSADLEASAGAYQRTKAKGSDLFLAKISSSLERVEFLTYFGGSDDDVTGFGNTIGFDSLGNIYFAGETISSDLPTTEGAYRKNRVGGQTDAFLAKMSPDGSRLLYCTYLGGSMREGPNYMHVTPRGEISLFGWTSSTDFPWTSDAFDITFDGVTELFYLEMDSLGMLTYCTLFGGNRYEDIGGVVYDEERDLFLMKGWTDSVDLPCTPGCYDPYYNGDNTDFFICAIQRTPPALTYCTYLGGSTVGTWDSHWSRNLVVDDEGVVYSTGYTTSPSFPTTTGAYCRRINSTNFEGVVFAIDPRPVPLPPAPTGLRAFAGDGFVNLSWDPPMNESYVTLGHAIYRGLTQGSLSFLANISSNASLNDTTDIINGKRYYYEVRAINSMGEGAAAGPVMARPMGPISEPLNLTARTGDGTVVLLWEQPEQLGGGDILGYQVWRGPTEDALELVDTVTDQTTYTDTAVVPGRTYWYAVTAFNEKTSGAQSPIIRIQALARASAPDPFEANAGGGWVLLSWGPPADRGGGSLLGYNVYRGLTQGEMALAHNALPNEQSFNDTGVVAGEYHYYYLVALTTAGEGNRTATLRALPSGRPGPPLDLVAVEGDEQVRLSWSAPSTDRGSPVTGYKVYSGHSADALSLVRKLDDIRQFPHKGLTNGATYWYAVSAINANGDGPRSETVHATPYGLPSTPVNLTAAVDPRGAVLTWGPPKDCGGSDTLTYRLLRGTTRDRLGTLVELQDFPAHGVIMWNDTSVEVGSTYFYSVLAISPNGLEGSRCNSFELLVALPPGPVLGLTALVDDGRVSLSWSPPTETGGMPLLGYVVMRGKGAGSLIEVGRTTNGTFEDTFVDNDQTYRYAVSARNIKGTGPYLTVINATPMARPLAPEGLRVSYEGGRAVLRWRPPAGQGAAITGYTVLKGTSLASMSVLVELVTGVEHVDGDVKAGERYYYSVRARNAIGDGAKATPVKLEVPEDLGVQRMVVYVLGLVLAIMVVVLLMRRRMVIAASPPGGPEGAPRAGPAGTDQVPMGDATAADVPGEGNKDGGGRENGLGEGDATHPDVDGEVPRASAGADDP